MQDSQIYASHRRPTMCTHTGIEFHPLEPRVEDVDIDDITWALGLKCRYTGHTNTFYSVAEHSVLVYRYCALRWPKGGALHRAALMHDASEAYLPDVTGPVKRDPRVGKWFIPIEDEVQRVISEAFDLEFPFVEEVHIADKEVLKIEIPELMPATDWWKMQPADDYAKQIKIEAWCYSVAQQRFMQTFRQLFCV